jgi:hypothetical protein
VLALSLFGVAGSYEPKETTPPLFNNHKHTLFYVVVIESVYPIEVENVRGHVDER